MSTNDATEKADNILNLMLTHQPSLIGGLHLGNSSQAAALARAIAAFRAELIKELSKHND